MSLTPKERARNYVWSRIEAAERDLITAERDLVVYNESGHYLSYEQVENAYRAAVSRRVMFNYLFKLIETDEQ